MSTDILTTYMKYERAKRASGRGGFLLPEDVDASIDLTAAELGLPREEVASILRAHWTMRGG